MFVSANFVKLAQKARVEIGQSVGLVWRFSTSFPFCLRAAQDALCGVLACGGASAPDRRQNALCGFVASVEGKYVWNGERSGGFELWDLRDNPSVCYADSSPCTGELIWNVDKNSPGAMAGAWWVCRGSGGQVAAILPLSPSGLPPEGEARGAGKALGGRFVTLGEIEFTNGEKHIADSDEETKCCLLFVCHVSPSFHAAEVSSALWKRAAASWALSRAARSVASIMWARRVSSAISSRPGRV